MHAWDPVMLSWPVGVLSSVLYAEITGYRPSYAAGFCKPLFKCVQG